MSIDLNTIKKQVTVMPPKLLIYGGEGLGKSSFASECPGIVMADFEGRLNQIHCAKFPQQGRFETYQQFYEFIQALLTQEHKFGALGIDGVGWLETLIHAKIAKEGNVAVIDDIPYGGGYPLALAVWTELLAMLDKLRVTRRMAIISVGHADVKEHKNPTGENYHLYAPKLHGKTIKNETALAKFIEWNDAVLFVHNDEFVKSETVGSGKNAKTTYKAVGGERTLYTTPDNPAYKAKNSYDLPARLPFKKNEAWAEFIKHFNIWAQKQMELNKLIVTAHSENLVRLPEGQKAV